MEVKLRTVGITGMSDYYVPKYWADANPDFSSYADLNNLKMILLHGVWW